MQRLLLRNVYKYSLGCPDAGEYFHLADIYSEGCVRLVRLLKLQDAAGGSGQLARYWQAQISAAIRQVSAELGLDRD